MVELECLRGVSIGLPTKYQALLIFCLFSINNGFAWLMFDPVSGELEEIFSGMSDLQIEILSSWQPVVYIAAFFPILRIVTRPDGLRRSVRLGASCELVGAGLKLLAVLVHSSPVALYILHLGQIFSHPSPSGLCRSCRPSGSSLMNGHVPRPLRCSPTMSGTPFAISSCLH